MKPKSAIRFTAVIAAFSLACCFILTGCKNKEAEPDELVMLCGSSFVEPAGQLCSQFTAQTGIRIVKTVAGSEDFLPLVKMGQKGDILITHDPYLDYVTDANALADSVQAGFVVPVLVVQKGNPKNIKSIEDLTRPGLKVAFSNPQYSTCGEMVAALLEKKGIKEAVMKNVGNRLTKGHSLLASLLKTQTVDAAIIWNGVAHTFRDSIQVVPTKYEYDTQIGVHIIGLNYTKQPEALKRFVDFARQNGPAVFAQYGYTK